MYDNKQYLAFIQSNIEKQGYHVTVVNSATEPRYAYTIGLSEVLGFELVFAGGIYYKKDELFVIFKTIVNGLKKEKDLYERQVPTDILGTFSLSKIDSSWSKLMLLGVFDYYNTNQIEAFQVIPDSNYYSLDIPDMKKQWNASSEPVWQYLVREWDYPVPKNSTVVTNLNALYGEAITEVMRWEETEWEMFAGAGPDVLKEDMRVVSLGILLGIDKTLTPALKLSVSKGLWRDSIDTEWNQWG